MRKRVVIILMAAAMLSAAGLYLATRHEAGPAMPYDFQYVQKIVVCSNGDVYASGISVYCNHGGVRSNDGGNTWTTVVGTYTGGGTCSNAHDFYGYDIAASAAGDLYA